MTLATDGPAPCSRQVEDLRREFDAAFAAPPPAPPPPLADLLLVRLEGARVALRVAELGGLFAQRKIAPLPGSGPELLGLAGIRGRLVAVYSLPALLGMPGDHAGRWLVLCAGEDRVGLSISDIDSHVKVPRAAIVAAPESRAGRRHITEIVQVSDAAHGVLSVPSLLAAIRRTATGGTPNAGSVPEE